MCGILGDRLGRQRMLVFVIMLISVATAAIGLFPTYAAIGFCRARAAFILMRLAQGFSVGGEAAGAMTFAERLHGGRRGLITSYAQIAPSSRCSPGPWSPLANFGLGQEAMEAWGWRIPFLLAIPMGLIGWYIRRAIADTPNFSRLKEGRPATNLLREAFATAEHRRAMLALFIPLMNGLATMCCSRTCRRS
ncbi:MHS family MFS transporter [Pseudonocardia sp. MCCB 268]|nr:MHS family MFS transporter [Pseudonocardia cytotoxica]